MNIVKSLQLKDYTSLYAVTRAYRSTSVITATNVDLGLSFLAARDPNFLPALSHATAP